MPALLDAYGVIRLLGFQDVLEAEENHRSQALPTHRTHPSSVPTGRFEIAFVGQSIFNLRLLFDQRTFLPSRGGTCDEVVGSACI